MSGGKLHVAFMLASLNVGGGERNMLNLARSLIERGHRADLVVPRFVGDYLGRSCAATVTMAGIQYNAPSSRALPVHDLWQWWWQ